MKKPIKKTAEQCRQLALDIVTGKAFSSDEISDPKDIGMVFMPILFMEKEKLDKIKPELLIGYYEDACNTGINGYPIFSKCRMYGATETRVIRDFIKVMKERMKEMVDSPVNPIDSTKINGELLQDIF